MIIRALAITCGLLILAAVAHATIVATGGYWTPQSYVTGAVAAGVGMAGILSGMAWSAGRRSLAVWLVVVIAAGEAFGFISTAERLIVGREAAQAPLRVAEQDRAKAVERVRNAQNALDRLPTTSRRLHSPGHKGVGRPGRNRQECRTRMPRELSCFIAGTSRRRRRRNRAGAG
jgi:hypothetical protein